MLTCFAPFESFQGRKHSLRSIAVTEEADDYMHVFIPPLKLWSVKEPGEILCLQLVYMHVFIPLRKLWSIKEHGEILCLQLVCSNVAVIPHSEEVVKLCC